MTEELKSKEFYVYELEHECVKKNVKCIVKGNINSKNIKKIIYYILYKYNILKSSEILTQFDIKDILVNYYGFEEINNADVYEKIELNHLLKNFYNIEESNNIVINGCKYEAKGVNEILRHLIYNAIERFR